MVTGRAISIEKMNERGSKVKRPKKEVMGLLITIVKGGDGNQNSSTFTKEEECS